MQLKKNISFFLPVALLLIGLYLVPLKIYGPNFEKVPGDLGDARFNNYILEHDHHYFTGKVNSYWDAPFMYPYANVIAFSDNLLGTAPIYSLFRLMGNDRETAYQFWLLTLFVLNFICCYWALKKWSDNTILSAVGAYIFAFSILLVGNIYNVQTFPRFIVPLVFYWCWKYFQLKEIKYFAYTCLGIVFQFYCGIYLGFLLLYALLFFFIAYILIYHNADLFKQFKNIKTSLYHLSVLVIAGVLFYPLIAPYIAISKETGMIPFENVLPSIPTVRSYFFTSKAPILWNSLSEHGTIAFSNWWCHFLFIGATPWLAVVLFPLIFLFKNFELEEQKFTAFLFLSLLLTFIFCLNINGFSLYQYIFKIPGFSAMRSMNRVINTEIMLFILLFVFVFNLLSKYVKFMKWGLLIFPVLVVFDNAINASEIMTYDKKESQQQIANIKKEIQTQYNKKYKAIAYMPIVLESEVSLHLNVMLASQELNVPCVNAYTGHHPSEYNDFFGKANDAGLTKWCNYTKIEKNEIQLFSGLTKAIKGMKRVSIQTLKGNYFCADKLISPFLIADRKDAYAWETFTMIEFENNTCSFLAYTNLFFCAEVESTGEISISRSQIGNWETFTIIPIDSNYVAFKADNGKYLSVDASTFRVAANASTIGELEKFKLSNSTF